MIEAPIDPAVFRSRAFEVDWVAPLTEPLHSREDPDLSRLALSHVLLAEAVRWMEIGERVGYFAEGSAENLPESELTAVAREHPDVRRVEEWLARETEPDELDICDFALALDLARADLTSERREFLRLVAFAESDEWWLRVTRVEAVAARAGEDFSAFPSETIDEIAWALEPFNSGDPERRPFRLPSGWRMQRFTDLTADHPRWTARLEQLALARAPLYRPARPGPREPVVAPGPVETDDPRLALLVSRVMADAYLRTQFKEDPVLVFEYFGISLTEGEKARIAARNWAALSDEQLIPELVRLGIRAQLES